MPENISVSCPQCGATCGAPSHDPILQCPQCGAQFFRPEPQSDEEPGVEAQAQSDGLPSEEELDGLRIRQIALLRRAGYRTRSYFVIAGGACLVSAIQLALMIYHRLVQTRLHMPPSDAVILAGYTLLLLAALLGVFYFERRILRLTRELRQPLQKNPAASPDFSPLSDGSHQLTNLEKLGR